MTLDLLLKGARIVDGTGAPPFPGDIGVQGGRIVAVGEVKDSAKRVIQADGLVTAPGFFDTHTHYDAQLLWDPLATPSSWHGITTVLIGYCGYTLAPCKPEGRDYLLGTLARVEAMAEDVLRNNLTWEWQTFGEYLRRLERTLGINVAAMVGHTAVRHYVMGDDSYQRAATPEEVKQMQALVGESLRAGAIGFSSSRVPIHIGAYGKPVPSRFATDEELFGLISMMQGMRVGHVELGIGKATPESRQVLSEVSKASPRPVHWNELGYSPGNPALLQTVLDLMDHLSSQGARPFAMLQCQELDLLFNLEYPYVFDPSRTAIAFPAWEEVFALPIEARKRAIADPAVRRKLQDEADELERTRKASLRWSDVTISRVTVEGNKRFQGRSIQDIAAELGKSPIDTFFDLALQEDLKTQFLFKDPRVINAEVLRAVLAKPYVVAGASDAGAHVQVLCTAGFPSKLLGYWVREQHLVSMEEAVRHMTSLPAQIFGFSDRGVLKPGKAADIVVFDPATINTASPELVHDLPGDAPRVIQRSEGIHYTIVNGQVLYENGVHTGVYPGKVLRSTDYR